MIKQSLLELATPLDAFVRNIGPCTVLFLVLAAPSPKFIVRVSGKGDLRTVDMEDIKVYGDPATGEALIPEIPKDWIKNDRD